MRWILIALGALLTLDTILVQTISNPNLGVYLPTIIGLPLLLIGLFWKPVSAFFATHAGKIIRWLLIGGYAAFAISFGIVAAKVAGYSAQKPEPGADAVIVLGAAVRGDVPSATLAARLDCALEYLKKSPETRAIVTGGQGDGENVTEASAMRAYLEARGIDSERIYEEDQSASTLENLQNAQEILKEFFPEEARILVVSSDYHLYRAKLVAQKLGLNVETMGSRSVVYLLPNFYLREYAAVMGYRLLGRLG